MIDKWNPLIKQQFLDFYKSSRMEKFTSFFKINAQNEQRFMLDAEWCFLIISKMKKQSKTHQETHRKYTEQIKSSLKYNPDQSSRDREQYEPAPI